MSAVNPLLEPGDSESPVIPVVEPVAEPAKEPEAVEAPVKEAPKEVDPEEKYNNTKTALRRERQAKAELESQLRALQDRVSQFDTLRNELESYRSQQKEQAEKAKFEENPAEYLRQQTETLSERVKRMDEDTRKHQEQTVQQQQFFDAVRSHAQAFAQENPDYSEALAYMHDRAVKEYELLGVPAEHWEAMFNEQSVQFAADALRRNQNPAEMVYKLAQARGYSKPKPKQDAMQRLEEGHRAAATLSTGGQSEESLLKSIDKMSDEEFDKFWDTNIAPNHR